MLIAVAIICFGAGFIVSGLVVEYLVYGDVDRKGYKKSDKPEPDPQPTRYSTEPITFAVESHHGKFVVIAKSRNDRTVVREDDLMPMADELRKHHEYLAVVNEVSGTYGVKVEESTQNEPPDPEALPEGKAEGNTNLPSIPTKPSKGFTGPTFFDFMQNSGVQRALYGDTENYFRAKAIHTISTMVPDTNDARRIADLYVADAKRRGILPE